MKTLHLYLTRQVIVALVMTVVVFTFVLLVGNVLKEVLALLVNRQADIGLVAEAIGLLIPFVWAFALPMAMLTATLLVFGRFSADQELTAARAGGISLLSLITPILLLSLLLCGVSAVVNLEIAPRARVAYKELLFKVALELSSAQLPEGRFITEHPGHTFFVRKNRNNQLEDVLVFIREGRATTILSAPRGRLRPDVPNRQLIVELLDARSVRVDGSRSMASSFAKLPVIVPLGSASKSPGKPRITDLTFAQLQAEIRELERQMHEVEPLVPPEVGEARDQRRELEHQRADLTSPLRVQMHRQVAFSFACFGFTLIGIPLGIRVHRRETNVSFAIALVLVLVYYSFIVLAQSLATRSEWSPHLIVWLPNFIFQAVGAVLLWRANRGM